MAKWMIKSFTALLCCLGLYCCIGTDIVDDFVEPRVMLGNPISAMVVGDSYQFEGAYFNNIGVNEPAAFQWTSSNVAVLEVDEQGNGLAKSPGTTSIKFTANDVSDSVMLMVFDPETIDEDSLRDTQQTPGIRTAPLKTVSSYQLEGSATLNENGGLKLELSDDFATTDALPGLYMYLTNNLSTVNNALEIGAVEKFSGSQVYEIPGDVKINDYSHILFYCKPFRVAVGTGEFMP